MFRAKLTGFICFFSAVAGTSRSGVFFAQIAVLGFDNCGVSA
jgi:hypothetical protein